MLSKLRRTRPSIQPPSPLVSTHNHPPQPPVCPDVDIDAAKPSFSAGDQLEATGNHKTPSSELELPRVVCNQDERMYWSCPSCSYDLCLSCCKDIRDGYQDVALGVLCQNHTNNILVAGGRERRQHPPANE